VDDATVGAGQPRTDPAQDEPAPVDPVRSSTPPDDPGARAKADVRAILAKALGLRRLVELAAELGGAPGAAAGAPRPELPRARYRRPAG
jgi:hypothetical protein